MVEQAKKYIRAGDIFQVVPSQRFSAKFERSPFAFYRALRRLNPSPFMFYVNFGDFQISGSSPEILVRVRDGLVTVRPIAGTLPRGKTPEADQANEQKLLADPKERAEHLMLLDLGRNDVGRVAARGTVEVTESFTVERYSHVMHIVSNVQGRLKEGEDMVSALAAGFPAGTTSGAPKIRAMEIITELEPHARGRLCRRRRLFRRRRRHGHLHRAAHGRVQGRQDPRAGRRRRRLRLRTRSSNSRKRCTRPAPSSAPPRKQRAMTGGTDEQSAEGPHHR